MGKQRLREIRALADAAARRVYPAVAAAEVAARTNRRAARAAGEALWAYDRGRYRAAVVAANEALAIAGQPLDRVAFGRATPR